MERHARTWLEWALFAAKARIRSDSGMRSKRLPTVFAVAAILVVSLVLAAVVAALGPSRYVVCGTGHVLDRIAQAINEPLGGGHTDGPTANYCVVPSTAAWLMAVIAFAAFAGASLLTMSRRRRPP